MPSRPRVHSRGFGDTVERFTSATGIKKVAEAIAGVTGSDCGCSKRRETLNRAFPYKE